MNSGVRDLVQPTLRTFRRELSGSNKGFCLFRHSPRGARSHPNSKVRETIRLEQPLEVGKIIAGVAGRVNSPISGRGSPSVVLPRRFVRDLETTKHRFCGCIQLSIQPATNPRSDNRDIFFALADAKASQFPPTFDSSDATRVRACRAMRKKIVSNTSRTSALVEIARQGFNV